MPQYEDEAAPYKAGETVLWIRPATAAAVVRWCQPAKDEEPDCSIIRLRDGSYRTVPNEELAMMPGERR